MSTKKKIPWMLMAIAIFLVGVCAFIVSADTHVPSTAKMNTVVGNVSNRLSHVSSISVSGAFVGWSTTTRVNITNNYSGISSSVPAIQGRTTGGNSPGVTGIGKNIGVMGFGAGAGGSRGVYGYSLTGYGVLGQGGIYGGYFSGGGGLFGSTVVSGDGKFNGYTPQDAAAAVNTTKITSTGSISMTGTESTTSFGNNSTCRLSIKNLYVSSFGGGDELQFLINSSNTLIAAIRAQYTSFGTGIGGDLILGTKSSSTGNTSPPTERLRLKHDGASRFFGNFSSYGNFYSTGTLTASALSGSLTGNVTGNCSGSSGSCTGNSATVTGLSVTSGKTLTAQNSITLMGTDSTTMTLPTTSKTLMASDYSNAGTPPTWNQNTTGTAANLSGTPALPNGTTATTQTAGDNSTKLATTAYCGSYAPLASPTFTGTPAAPTASVGTNTTQIATTAFVGLADKVGQASIAADSGAINTTETIIVKTPQLAANRLAAGQNIRITLDGTCTSSATNTSTFAVRLGTAGTTSDALMLTATTATAATSGTSVPFKAVIQLTVRTTGSSATCVGKLELYTTSGTATGISTVPVQVLVMTPSSFNTTTASLYLSATYKSAASTTTCTFNQAYIEFANL